MLRFAPSPTGDMHIGNLRAAIFNYIIARQNNEKFLIRIEDTDQERNQEGKDKDILYTLTLFGLMWDQLVYQSENIHYHHKIAEHLIKEKKAFYCFCTEEFLEQKRKEAKECKRAFRYKEEWKEIHKSSNPYPVVRLHGAQNDLSYYDKIKGNLVFKKEEIESFVILRKDKSPTYNFACAVDDMLYDISMIIRGEDHTTNTPKQILVHQAMEYPKKIEFAHIPIILNEEGKKMSKREQSSSVKWLLEQGFLPQAISNYLIAMGNNTPTEVFTLQESIAWFNIEHISKSPVKFDIKRLKFLNREHFKRIHDTDLALMLGYKDASIGLLAKFYLQESSTLNEIQEAIDLIFGQKNMDNENFINFKKDALLLQQHIHQIIAEKHPCLSHFDDFKKELMNRSLLSGKKFFKPLRILLTGRTEGPEISDLYPLIWCFLKDITQIKETH